MALRAIVQSVNDGCSFVVDVDLKSYFDTISHELLLELVERRVGDVQILRLIRAWLKAGVMEEGKVTHPDRGSPQGGVISPTLSNIFLHEVDRQWCRNDGVALGNVRLVRYADDMVLLARTEQQARVAWEQLQGQFAALRLVVNQEKSRLTTLVEGFAFLGFEFRKAPGRMLLMWPREKACRNIRQRVREAVRSIPSNGPLGVVIQKLNPILNGWCTYFRVGNSNRTFHKVDWAVRSELQLWLRRKHRCPWRTAKKASSDSTFASSTVSTEGRRRGGRGTSSSTARHMAEGDRPVASIFAMIAAFWAGVQLTAIRAVTFRFWLPLLVMTCSCIRGVRLRRGLGVTGIQSARLAGGQGRGSPAAVDGRIALVQVHGGTRLVDGGPGGERSLPTVEGPGSDEIAPVGCTGRRSCSGGCNGGRSCPLAKMRRSRWRVEHAHILRAVRDDLFLSYSAYDFHPADSRTKPECIDVTAS